MGDNHGRVTSRAKCPKCGGRSWDLTGEHGFDLLKCRTCGQLSNKLPIIRLSWENADLTIVYGRMGNRLTTVEDAVTELKLIRQAIQAEDFDPEDYAGKIRGSHFWANWLAKQAAREQGRVETGEIAPSTLRKRRALWAHLRVAFDLNIKEIKFRHIEDWLLTVKKSQKYRRDLVEELRRLLHLAHRRREIDRVPHLPTVRVDEKPIKFLTESKQALVLEHLSPVHRPSTGFILSTASGRPRSALCAGTWSIWMSGFSTWPGPSRTAAWQTPTKGRAAMAMPITRTDLAIFVEAAEAAKRDGVVPAGKVPVFRNPEADPNRNPAQRYLPDFLTSRWNKAVAEAGLPPIRLYSGRHSRAMQLKKRHVPQRHHRQNPGPAQHRPHL